MALRSRLTAAAACAALSWAGAAQAETPPPELAIKAAYLYKLAPFVTWPAAAFASPNAPLAICVQGTDPFGALLDRAVAGQRVGLRPLVVRRLARLEAGSGCHIAYVAGSAEQPQAQALQAVERAPVLTVTDDALGSANGVVRLSLNGGKVRFSIDAAQAEANGLAISSKLLALAQSVKR